MNCERQFDGVRMNGVPLADVLKDQRDNRIIKVRDREVAVQMKSKKKHSHGKFAYATTHRIHKKDLKPAKGRHLSIRELEEAKMEKEIRKINKEGLTQPEAIYMAFKENGWKELRTPEVGYAIGIKGGIKSINPIIYKMKLGGMLTCEKRGHKKFFYQVPEDIQGLGRVGWANMYREIDNDFKRKQNEKKKSIQFKPSSSNQSSTPSISSNVRSELSGNTPRDPADVANDIHRLVDDLDRLAAEARSIGLTVKISQSDIAIDSKVYKEY